MIGPVSNQQPASTRRKKRGTIFLMVFSDFPDVYPALDDIIIHLIPLCQSGQLRTRESSDGT
jgi:hypothetical protein